MTTPEAPTFHKSVERLAAQFSGVMALEADLLHMHPDALRDAVFARLSSGNEYTFRDGRASGWRVRVRLFEEGKADPVADTDPDLPAQLPGTTIKLGLPSVADFASFVAINYHGVACIGLESEGMRRKIASLRTQLSNKKQDSGWFNVDYELVEVHSSVVRATQMVMRCDVQRVSQSEPELRRMPGT